AVLGGGDVEQQNGLVGDAADDALVHVLASAERAAVGTGSLLGSVPPVLVEELGLCGEHACLSWSEESWPIPLLWGRHNPFGKNLSEFFKTNKLSASARSVPFFARLGLLFTSARLFGTIDPMSVASILGPGGTIARRLQNYEARPQQLAMAEAVAEA